MAHTSFVFVGRGRSTPLNTIGGNIVNNISRAEVSRSIKRFCKEKGILRELFQQNSYTEKKEQPVPANTRIEVK